MKTRTEAHKKFLDILNDDREKSELRSFKDRGGSHDYGTGFGLVEMHELLDFIYGEEPHSDEDMVK